MPFVLLGDSKLRITLLFFLKKLFMSVTSSSPQSFVAFSSYQPVYFSAMQEQISRLEFIKNTFPPTVLDLYKEDLKDGVEKEKTDTWFDRLVGFTNMESPPESEDLFFLCTGQNLI